MHFTTLLSFLPLLVHSSSVPSSPQSILTNLPDGQNALKIPSSYESAVMARRILHLTPLGTLSTVFPSPSHMQDEDGSSTLEQRPAGLSGIPIGLMDYIADCESSGDPTILAINIATSFKNVAAGSNISLALQWTPPHPPSSRIKSWFSNAGDSVPYSAANLPRFSLLGYLEKMEDTTDLRQCFVDVHPDAKYWLPGNKIHSAEWVRLVVQDIYWIGGFGDRAYIGWIPVDEWRNVTESEWQDIRLPGEKKGWKEWSVSGWEL